MGIDTESVPQVSDAGAASRATPDDSFRVARIAAPMRQSVVASLRNAIATGRFKAGDRLTEREVCEMIGVSRTLVREAFRQLESERLITVVPSHGPVVSRVTPEQAEGIYEVRCLLEGLASELFAAHATEAEQRALRQALKNIEATIRTGDPLARLNAKNEFYDCLLRGARNEALAQTLSLLNSRIMVLRSTSLGAKGRAKESIKELGLLVEALVARDVKRARAAAVRHVQNAAEVALRILRSEQPDGGNLTRATDR